MDTYLLTKFEKIMEKSIISPYIWARILITGAFLTICYFSIINFPNVFFFYGLACLVYIVYLIFSLHILYKLTFISENDHRKQYSVRYREEFHDLRAWSLFIVGIVIILTILEPMFFKPVLITIVTWTVYLYLISINWLAADKRTLKPRAPHKRVISKIKRRAF